MLKRTTPLREGTSTRDRQFNEHGPTASVSPTGSVGPGVPFGASVPSPVTSTAGLGKRDRASQAWTGPKPGKRKRKAAANKRPSPETPEPYEFDDTRVEPGTLGRVDLRVARLPTGTWISLPVFILHGARPGPTVWLSAALHGDELNGIVIIRRLLAELHPSQVSGTLLAVPVANAFGATTASRYLPDGRDLNRCFPGSKRGSLASRLAHLLFHSVVMRCSVGIDLHTGSGGRFNLPQIRCDTENAKTRRLAEAFGAPVLLHSALRDDSLRAEAGKRGIRVLLYEGGEADRLDPKCIAVGVAGVRRVMKSLGMVAHCARAEAPSLLSRKSVWLRAPRSGFFHATVRCGQRVSEGQHVGVVFDTTSATAWIPAKVGGIVIGERRTAVVHRGDAVLHIATL